jgi:hypothetical protein
MVKNVLFLQPAQPAMQETKYFISCPTPTSKHNRMWIIFIACCIQFSTKRSLPENLVLVHPELPGEDFAATTCAIWNNMHMEKHAHPYMYFLP